MSLARRFNAGTKRVHFTLRRVATIERSLASLRDAIESGFAVNPALKRRAKLMSTLRVGKKIAAHATHWNETYADATRYKKLTAISLLQERRTKSD